MEAEVFPETHPVAAARWPLRPGPVRRGIETRTPIVIPIDPQWIYHEVSRGPRFRAAEQRGRRGPYLPSGTTFAEAEMADAGEVLAEAREERR